MALPELLKPFFWDVDFGELRLEEHRDLIISRIAEHGTDEAVRWLKATYGDAEIAGALESRRAQLSPRTLALWRLWLKKPEDWCAKTPSRPLKGVFWRG
ncbi:MAG: hypothetical protein HY721_18705 [Planctomycetes bacterium]|nr:hypothetical protein [Planctomycetota bacterium]